VVCAGPGYARAMSDIVHIQHPVPVTYLSRRGTKERTVLARHVTPVRLRHVDAAEVRPAARLEDRYVPSFREDGHHFHAYDGRLWLRLAGMAPGQISPRFDIAAFKAFLAGDPNAHKVIARTDADIALHRTPVFAVVDGYKVSQGEAFDRAAAGRIVHDGTEEAVEALRRFVEDSILLAGDGVFVRTGGPLAMTDLQWANPDLVLGALPRMDGRMTAGIACRMDQAEAFWDWVRETCQVRHDLRDRTVSLQGYDGGIDPALFGDDDIALFVNAVPQMLPKVMEDALHRHAKSAMSDAVKAREAVAALGAWEAKGRMSAIPEAEFERVLVLARDAMRAINRADFRVALRGDGLAMLSYIEDRLLPRLRNPELSDDDEAAFSAIAPGGI